MYNQLPPEDAENPRKLQVLECLANVLKDNSTLGSERQRSLVRYLVTEEIEGRGDRIKAFSIATDVFGRAADFDPQTDSIVRVEMGRLRRTLEFYYATGGAGDPVRICFEKGSYRPSFQWIDKPPALPSIWRRRAPRAAIVVAVLLALLAGAALVRRWPFGASPFERAAAPGTSTRPRVAVTPFVFSSDAAGQDYLAAGLQGELTGILAEFDCLAVLAAPSNRPLEQAEAEAAGKVDYILRNMAQLAGDKLLVWVLLADGKTGAVLWSNRYENRLDAGKALELQRGVAARIASDLGRPLGIIASLEKARLEHDSFRSAEGAGCYLRTLKFMSNYNPDLYRDARQCAETAVKYTPRDANALALLALLRLAGQSAGYDKAAPAEGRVEASRLAMEAFRLDDLASLPRMAAYAAALCGGDEELFRRVVKLSLRDYPNNPTILIDIAHRSMLGADDWSEGMKLLARANELNPIGDPVVRVLEALNAWRSGQNDQAILATLGGSLGPLPPVWRVIEMALRAHAGDRAGAERVRSTLQDQGCSRMADYLDHIDRACWTQKNKDMIRKLLAEK